MTISYHFHLLIATRNQDIFKYIISVFHGTSTPRAAASRYHVPIRNILQLTTKLESVQKVWENSLVEYQNQQHISRWLRYNINIPSPQHQWYTEWELCAAFETRIMAKSTYNDLLDEFGVPKTTLWQTLNVLFPPLNFIYLNHQWDLLAVRKVVRKRVREVIGITTVKTRIGIPTNILIDKEE